MMDERTFIIQKAARMLIGIMADLIYADPHSWSERPCPTCGAITAILGEPFGCDRYRKEKQNAREAK